MKTPENTHETPADKTEPGDAIGTKKPYSSPRLVVYGDLRTLTENRMRSGADGGTGGSQFSS